MESIATPSRPATSEDATLDTFRRWGYLQADVDPLERLEPAPHPELDAFPRDDEAAARGRRAYCGPIGLEFMHIPDPERRRFLAELMEGDELPAPDRSAILDQLIRAETFEQVLQSRYLGTKRFSLEGVTATLPLLHEMLDVLAENDARQVVLAMSHRGRLNLMHHLVGTSGAAIFAGFEDVSPRSVLGGGDVKYHLGATGVFETRHGKTLRIHLVSNPSHLEAVDPVALGRVRAKQQRLEMDHEVSGEDQRYAAVVPVILHGDAAFAGQGILAETLNLQSLPGFDVGGALHVIVNNFIGFTTEPYQLYSSRFSSDVAKRLSVPILHVNGEDPDAVVRAGRIAALYRAKYHTDVVIDLIGYRRHGHSEIDDPTITQPRLYRLIEAHPPLWQLYGRRIGVSEEETQERVSRIKDEMDAYQKEASGMQEKPKLAKAPSYWDDFMGGCYEARYEVETGLPPEILADLGDAITRAPEDFHVHPKIEKLLEQRRKMAHGEVAVDFGMAEALALGSLLRSGVPVRMSGQDSRRATFAQRHAVLIDTEDESETFPLNNVVIDPAFFEVYDSMLSEAAVLGFEYGFSRDYPEALVLWEAQFGDFVNGAQIIIDQFISAGEDKWGLLSGLVMLLPHGFEGQGPEHSSARMERFLQLCAEDNMQVCQPSTAAQYFHLLRRQALRKWRKPLIVFTPKSMLRHKDSASEISEFTREHFLRLVPDPAALGPAAEKVEQVIFCSGKIGHELRRERDRREDDSTAVIFLDQLYPFPEREVREALGVLKNHREVLWVQEEPANMGPLFFVEPILKRLTRKRFRSFQRSASGSPATGSGKAHQMEQKTLVTLPFELRSSRD
jgi:2-oxoglutarate dehydrogenase E1 component